jgi:hypothetical protein
MLVAFECPREFESANHRKSTGFLGFGNLVIIDYILEARVILQEYTFHPIALLSEILHHNSEYLF